MLLIFELGAKFVKELQSIQFSSEKGFKSGQQFVKGRRPEDFHRKSKFFDFYANQNATASSLALAIYQ